MQKRFFSCSILSLVFAATLLSGCIPTINLNESDKPHAAINGAEMLPTALSPNSNILIFNALDEQFYEAGSVTKTETAFNRQYTLYPSPALPTLNTEMSQAIEDQLKQMGYHNIRMANVFNDLTHTTFPRHAFFTVDVLGEWNIDPYFVRDMLEPYTFSMNLLNPFPTGSHAIDFVLLIGRQGANESSYLLNCHPQGFSGMAFGIYLLGGTPTMNDSETVGWIFNKVPVQSSAVCNHASDPTALGDELDPSAVKAVVKTSLEKLLTNYEQKTQTES